MLGTGFEGISVAYSGLSDSVLKNSRVHGHLCFFMELVSRWLKYIEFLILLRPLSGF